MEQLEDNEMIPRTDFKGCGWLILITAGCMIVWALFIHWLVN